MNNINIGLAFLAGIISFLSPCVLPLIPGYVSFVTGITPDKKPKSYSETLVPLIMFVLGFTFVFTLLGASATFAGSILKANKDLLSKIAGVFIFVVGLYLLGIIKLNFLEKSNQNLLQSANKSSSFIMGIAFAIGWTPCIGPILGSILLVASSAETAAMGSILLLSYSLGLGIPLVVFGQSYAWAKYRSNWLRNNSRTINKIGGTLMLLMGILLFTGKLTEIAIFLQRIIPQNWQYF